MTASSRRLWVEVLAETGLVPEAEEALRTVWSEPFRSSDFARPTWR